MKIRLISTLVLAAAGLLAQGPGGFARGGGMAQPPVDQVKSYLSLTDAQVTALQGLLTQERTANQTAMQSIAAKEKSLHDQLQAGSQDAAALGQLLLDIQALRKQISDSRAANVTQAVDTLTADQKTKLATLTAAQALRPAINQAEFLGLLAPPKGEGTMSPFGFGAGPMGRRGPGAPMMAPPHGAQN